MPISDHALLIFVPLAGFKSFKYLNQSKMLELYWGGGWNKFG